MKHLSPDVLVDLAEGARDESSAPHLGACAECRRRLADLRGTMSAASGVEVPEPSPLFWNHLSARVRQAVETEGTPGLRWWSPSTWPRLTVPVLTSALALIILAVMLSPRVIAPERPASPADAALTPASPPAAAAVPAVADAASDPALDLVADLASQMDFDSASEVALAVHAGAMDEAFGELSVDERREMQQLLRDLGRPGI